MFRDDFLESDRPGWKYQVSSFFRMMPCFGVIMTSGNSSVAFASCFIHGRDRTKFVVSGFGFGSCGRRSDSATSTMSRDMSHVTKYGVPRVVGIVATVAHWEGYVGWSRGKKTVWPRSNAGLVDSIVLSKKLKLNPPLYMKSNGGPDGSDVSSQ